MDKEIQKINSLLKFYNKKEVIVSLRIKYINNLVVRGKIIKKNPCGRRYVIIEGREKGPIKIFLEDVVINSIIPLDYEKKESKNIRTPISKALRHEILKRDRYTCQSCGARAPDVELEVDHKIPISKGGTDDKSNLTTSCKDCNRGKGASV